MKRPSEFRIGGRPVSISPDIFLVCAAQAVFEDCMAAQGEAHARVVKALRKVTEFDVNCPAGATT